MDTFFSVITWILLNVWFPSSNMCMVFWSVLMPFPLEISAKAVNNSAVQHESVLQMLRPYSGTEPLFPFHCFPAICLWYYQCCNRNILFTLTSFPCKHQLLLLTFREKPFTKLFIIHVLPKLSDTSQLKMCSHYHFSGSLIISTLCKWIKCISLPIGYSPLDVQKIEG